MCFSNFHLFHLFIRGYYKNLAEGAPTKQSTIHPIYYAPGSRANDLNMDGDFFSSYSCTFTNTELTPWWSVDVGEVADVYAVSIVRRTEYNQIDSKLMNKISRLTLIIWFTFHKRA